MKLAALLVTSTLFAADWTLYRQGPFEVVTDRDRKRARDVLNHLEQLRWAFGQLTGKVEPKTLWPIRVRIARDSTAPGFRTINDSWTATLSEKAEVPVGWNVEILQILIDNNLGRMPLEIERGLVAALSTAEVSGVHVVLGLAPPKPDLDWARMHVLIASEDYRGRVRVLLGNLERGTDPEVAFRNSLGKTRVEIDKEAQAILDGKTIPTADLSGKPVNPARDFSPREPDADYIARLTETESAPATFMGMLAQAQRSKDGKAILEEIVKKKSEWAEPYRLLSALESDAGRKAGLLKKAAELSPRDSALWTQFAELMTEYRRFVDADKAWAAAEKAAPDTAAKAAVRAKRSDLVEQRAESAAEAKREEKIARERDIQRVRNDTVAGIRAAEAKVNAGKELPPGTKVEQWWDEPKPDAKLAGTLRRVDCLGKQLRLAVESGSKLIQIMIRDPCKLVVEGTGETSLGCGAQKPRAVEVEYFAKPDAKLNAMGEAAVLRFP